MKVQKIILIITAALVLAALCYAQSTPKITEIKPGTIVQWPFENTVIITTTVSQSIEREDLLQEKQRLQAEITQYQNGIVQYQNEITLRQEQITYVDLIIASYKDPNSP